MAEPTIVPAPKGQPTQVAHPGRAVLRFIVAWVVGGAIAWLARTIGLDLTAFGPEIVDAITAGLALLIASAVQWLLTREGVEDFLEGTPLSTGVDTEGPRHRKGDVSSARQVDPPTDLQD